MPYTVTTNDIKEFKRSLQRELENVSPDELRPTSRSPDEDTCSRFLRARKGDIAAAIKQYVDAEKWFKEVGFDTILDQPDKDEAVYQRYCPHANLAYDREHRPVYFERTGAVKLPEVVKELSPELLITRHVRQQAIAMRRLQDTSKRLGRPIEKQVVIMDLKNLSLRPDSVGLSIFKECIRIDQNYFPERLECFFFLNSPWIFRPLWAIVKPWLDPVTKRKFHVLGSKYEEELFKVIDRDQLPAEFGGTAPYDFPNVKPGVRPTDTFTSIPNSEYDPALRPHIMVATATSPRVNIAQASPLPDEGVEALSDNADHSRNRNTTDSRAAPAMNEHMLFDLNRLFEPVEKPSVSEV
eukprot:TRINITY_DN10004_c0_g1_i1.p1 TRINITY_DN10004_c0_g1~~TRINITY_DN10004_c0_g1_i1.p1  ORF type:complete len:353 (+),score=38.44 TRINITY_DN10004_c0_g1_i1:87-1145(+)